MNWSLLLLRIAVGAIFIVHGIQKQAMWKLQPSAQMPSALLRILRLLSIVEPLGGVAMIAGFLTRPAAIGFTIIMLGAINLKARQLHKGFTGDGGWELDFSVLAATVALLVTGGGAISVDHVLHIV